jgi:hypothetical protein
MAQAHKYRAIVDWNTANNCPSTLERSGTETGTGVYKTSQTISAPPTGQTNVISAASNVLYQAGSSVLLKPGFRADKGSVFYAVIRGCD